MFKSLTSLFVEVSPSTPPPASTPKEAPRQTEAAPPPAAPPQAPPPPAAVQGAVNEEMLEFLAKAIEASNLDGFDYLEFRNSLAAMAQAPLTEQQKYTAVFATASTMGLTKEKLLGAIDHYQSVVDSKKSEFQAQVEQSIAQEVTRREELKAQKESEIEALRVQIQEMQAAIGAKQQEALEIDMEIGQQRLSIQQTASSFEATYNVVSGKLQSDRQKITAYIA